MAEYRLTQRAWVDLIDINDFTEGKFGACQTEAYYVALVRSCWRERCGRSLTKRT